MSERVKISGVPFDPVTYEEALSQIADLVSMNAKAYVVTPNPEMVLNASKDDGFKAVLKGAALSIPDGIGILWASYYLSLPLPKHFWGWWFQLFASLGAIFFVPQKIRRFFPQRVTGTDLLYKIVDFSQRYGWRIFFLGAREGVAQKATAILRACYPKANFAGCFAGSPQTADEDEIRKLVNAASPDILFVAYG
ncbi:WecB/TagA/CpsF family glycosyltransferase, partial [Candidatus Peregrinibacteria bacterium]|nr:WecB/TagA/CpsF family glycosyltransferase [Candidatus Peregrinibacteria bacterium]